MAYEVAEVTWFLIVLAEGGGGGGVKTTNEYQNFATVDGFSIFTVSDSYEAD